MIYYKFTTAEHALKTLRELRLKASSPTEFNDIFEFCPVSEPHSLMRRVIADPVTVRHLYEVEVGNGYTKSFEYFRANDIQRRLISRLPLVDLAAKDLDSRVEASKYIRVICLCRSPSLFLLWSHYADSHKGCAIGIDVRNKSFKRARIHHQVKYSRRRPPHRWDARGPAFWKQLIRISITKARAWSYEREYRLAFAVEELEQDGGHHFVAFQPGAVRRVIYGDQMDWQTRRKIDEVLEHRDYAHVRRCRAERHPRGYSLRLAPLK